MKNPFTPDFNNAKVGDACFCVNKDMITIKDTFKRMLDAVRTIYGNTYDINGRYLPSDKHPSLFNSFQQFMDYWKWEKENGGQDADTE